MLSKKLFGEKFLWGVAISAAQNEGAYNIDGRGLSIWDVFARRQGKIKGRFKPNITCDFYHRYKDDLLLVKTLGFRVFRFSFSWSRILPDGTGKINKEGIAFYHRVIDECLKLDIIPYVTLYHWDLPHELEKEGGWSNDRIVRWFNRYATICAVEFGAEVKNWLILNEPIGFTSLGYMLAKHAPGKANLNKFLAAIHNAVLAQAEGGRAVRENVKHAHIGTTFSCSEIIPFTDKEEDRLTAKRLDIILNRLFIEPALGRGYPQENFRFLEKLELYNHAWKYTKQMQFNFDFIGLQNYFPLVVKYNSMMPIIHAAEVKASTRKVSHTLMGWEINEHSFYRVIKRFWLYGSVKEIIITESGAAFRDKLTNGVVNDEGRIKYHQQYLNALLKAKKESVNVTGYFVWTLMDNFEWAEGIKSPFGLVHVDFKTQLRTIKNSGSWFRDFLNEK